MSRAHVLAAALAAALAAPAVRADDKPAQQPGQPRLQELMKVNAKTFIERLDKNKDGFLTKDELPERLAQLFDRADANGDGKLDEKEVEQLLATIRKRLGGDKGADSPDAKKEAPASGNAERFVDM